MKSKARQVAPVHKMITTHQGVWSLEQGWISELSPTEQPCLLLIFGSRDSLKTGDLIKELTARWPKALLLGCSTAGQIRQTELHEETVIVNAWHFQQTRLAIAEAELTCPEDSYEIGMKLSRQLHQPDLAHVLVLAEGLAINGSSLVKGIQAGLSPGVLVSGGLAGDGDGFEETVICTSRGVFSHYVAAVGFYGPSLHVGCGSCGGWDPFGVERLITYSKGNELLEMDGQSALALYSKYLGELASGLPSTGLLFPLEVRQGNQTVVRTILGINENRGSLIFTGEVPEGAYARLMKTNYEQLIDGASQAAQHARKPLPIAPQAAILISCVGRKMVLNQRTEEELEAIQHVLGQETGMSGFYSYGEIAPGIFATESELHNQTMTITLFSERVQ